ncbi:hypothetical protein PH242_04815 [Photorhabdus bodei]|uniref:glycosyltransferase family 2 protein n=1 Tax=Photorhabdus bodei TaxID=2029681 RepID=UPI00232CF69A|nr:glycosyltransferase [Photorhabdus bodei]MDB6367017.1 hypothetical protein [Photorhabdus bodei]
MNIEIIISTINNNIFSLLNRLEKNDQLSYLIIHQISNYHLNKEQSEYLDTFKREDIRIIRSYSKGLSLSRNIGIKNISDKSDIVIFSDDDNQFILSSIPIIEKIYNRNNNISGITFKIKTDCGLPFKNYPQKSYFHNIRSIFKISSIEMTFRKELLKNSKYLFNESFGLGTEYPACEESLFMSQIIKDRVNILFSPHYITIHPHESSGKDFFNKDQARARSKAFREIFTFPFGTLAIILFFIRKINIVPKGKKFSFLFNLLK